MGRIATKKKDDPSGGFDTVVWGTVSRDAEVTQIGERKTPKVKFGVAYDKGQFMNCAAFGNTETAQFAASLEKGDKVLCAGVWTRRTWTGNDNKERVTEELNCDVIFAPSLLYQTAFRVPGDQDGETYSEGAEADEAEEYVPQV